MDYIKLFDNHSDYETFRLSNEFKKPNLSYCENPGEVHFNQNDQFNNYDYVDLGLPSGTLWAKYNLGATNEYDAGSYYAWGETETKDEYTQNNYKWYDPNDPQYRYYYYTNDATTLYLEDDAARVNMKGKWQIPSLEQVQELGYNAPSFLNKLYVDNYNNTGIPGLLITSTITNNTLFIPSYYSTRTYYLTNRLNYSYAQNPNVFFIESNTTFLTYDDSGMRYDKFLVRAVISGENA